MFVWKEKLCLSKMLLSLFWILKISLLLTLFSSSDILPITQYFLISGEPWPFAIWSLCGIQDDKPCSGGTMPLTSIGHPFQECISQAQSLFVLFSYQGYKFISSESWKQVTLLFNSPLPNHSSTRLQSLQLINLNLNTCNYCNLNNLNYSSI